MAWCDTDPVTRTWTERLWKELPYPRSMEEMQRYTAAFYQKHAQEIAEDERLYREEKGK